MTIKIEIPSGNEYKPLAAAVGAALVQWGSCMAATSNTTVTSDEKATLNPKLPVETATVQESSTTRQSSESVTASSQSSEEEVKTTSGSQEQSNARQGADGAGDATVANDTIVAGISISDNDASNLDEKGVGFNEKVCGKAAKPFYGSGKTKGQWKRRGGVDQSVYNAWYSESLAAVSSTSTCVDNVTQIDTASAFQNGEVVNDGQNHQPQGAGGLTFADGGLYLMWQSEQQAAELITNSDIDSAYAAVQCTVADLFDPSKSANTIAAVYNYLSNIAAGEQ